MSGQFWMVVRHFSNSLVISGKMPKPKAQKPKSAKKAERAARDAERGPVTVDKGGNISIKILAKPGAKCNNITDISEDAVGIQISAPPVEGEANTELVKYLADVFGLRKSDITLDRGSKSRQKTVLIQSSAICIEDVIEKLQEAVDGN